MADERYFLAQDNSCHWYVVPVAREAEWSEWSQLDEDDERGWEPPGWARPLGGSPRLCTFTDPEIK